jgi:hypothetical protein
MKQFVMGSLFYLYYTNLKYPNLIKNFPTNYFQSLKKNLWDSKSPPTLIFYELKLKNDAIGA